ncbi:MAG: YbaK/EbsC family protein [Haloferacaceae archaeon]
MHPRAAEFRERVRERHDLTVEVEEFPEGTRTAADAADAIGCAVDRIASSLVFETGAGVVVVVASGADRVSEAKLAEALDVSERTVTTADPGRVREVTGWSIGGVPPLCHDGDPRVLVDGDLLDRPVVYAAAGTPEAVFRIDPDRLRRLAGAETVDVTGDDGR